jgi:RND superfamily putative drug exporter
MPALAEPPVRQPAAPPRRPDEPRSSALARSWAWLVVTLRWPIVLAWLAAAVVVSHTLPQIGNGAEASAQGLVPSHSAAVATDERSYHLFGTPLLTQTVVVQRAPHGLSSAAQERVVRRASLIDHRGDASLRQIAFALPVLNTAGVVRFARERSTTAVTYLYFRSATSLTDQVTLAHTFAARYASRPDDHLVGVTGGLPALVPLVPFREFALVMAIGVLVDSFIVRSLLAPALVTTFGRAGGWPGRRLRAARES